MLDYDKEESEAYKKNIINLKKKLDNNIVDVWLEDKIKKYAANKGLDDKLIRHKLLNDDLFFIEFAKNPKKQSFHQKLALDYLKSNVVSNAIQLNSSGADAKMVKDGVVVFLDSLKNSYKETKTIDFEWSWTTKDGKIIKFYALHKHTKEPGGAQDNQFKDVQAFMKHCNKCINKDEFFLAICDGAYYQMKYEGYDSRIEYLNSIFKKGRVKALTVNDVGSFLCNEEFNLKNDDEELQDEEINK